MREIAVEGEYVARIEIIGHMNETGIGEVCRSISVLAENLPDLGSAAG